MVIKIMVWGFGVDKINSLPGYLNANLEYMVTGLIYLWFAGISGDDSSQTPEDVTTVLKRLRRGPSRSCKKVKR